MHTLLTLLHAGIWLVLAANLWYLHAGREESQAGASAGGNAPGGNAPGGNAPGGNAPGGNAPGGNAPGGNAPGGNAPGGNAPGGNAPGGNAPGGNAPGGNAPGGNAPGGNAPGGNAPGGNAPGGNAPGGNAPGGNAPGGNAPGGNAPGGNAPGGNAPGGNAPGGNAPGGNAPRLSVLIPARNEARNLRRLLPSLLEQTHPDAEVIVYDDGSSDGTAAVLRDFAGDFEGRDNLSLRVLRGAGGPPPGWVGKTHALHQAAEQARGDAFLFLDADARLEGPRALERLAERFRRLPEDGDVLTGFPRLRGAALLLVSIVPSAILTGLPWPLVRRTPSRPALGALNGQCWMIGAEVYRRHRPHAACRDDVLEDVEIGRFLKSKGHTPVMRDVTGEVSIFMYDGWAGAWRGFRKNAYLLMGGTPLAATLFIAFFSLTFVLAPLFEPGLWGSVFGLKAVTDWRSGQPVWVSLLAPLSFALAVALQVDSTVSHWRGTVEWKGRRVA